MAAPFAPSSAFERCYRVSTAGRTSALLFPRDKSRARSASAGKRAAAGFGCQMRVAGGEMGEEKKVCRVVGRGGNGYLGVAAFVWERSLELDSRRRPVSFGDPAVSALWAATSLRQAAQSAKSAPDPPSMIYSESLIREDGRLEHLH